MEKAEWRLSEEKWTEAGKMCGKDRDEWKGC
jgi:hypothetical protein